MRNNGKVVYRPIYCLQGLNIIFNPLAFQFDALPAQAHIGEIHGIDKSDRGFPLIFPHPICLYLCILDIVTTVWPGSNVTLCVTTIVRERARKWVLEEI